MSAAGFDPFVPVTLEQIGRMDSLACVLWDAELSDRIRHPFFVQRWGLLYIGSATDAAVVWCWSWPDGRWDDISGGSWANLRLGRDWQDAVDRAYVKHCESGAITLSALPATEFVGG